MSTQFIQDCDAAKTIEDLERVLVRHANFDREGAHDLVQGMIRCNKAENLELANLIRSYT